MLIMCQTGSPGTLTAVSHMSLLTVYSGNDRRSLCTQAVIYSWQSLLQDAADLGLFSNVI